MRASRLLAGLLAAAGWSGWPLPVPAAPISWSEVEALPLPAAGDKIAYGEDPLQFGELRLPIGATAPVPVVLLLHGGCWQNQFDYVYITRLAAALAQQGYAVWTPEFRRIGDPGGAWPNTLLDAALAADHLRQLAQRYPLDLDHVVAIGHSAGGQLALWLAARGKLPPDSELHSAQPLRLRGVIGLDAITDLATYRIGPADSCHAAVDELMGGTPQAQPRRYAEASPLALLPLGLPQWFVQGSADGIVSPDSIRRYAIAAQRAGDRVAVLSLAGAGHFESVVPRGPAWKALLGAVREALR